METRECELIICGLNKNASYFLLLRDRQRGFAAFSVSTTNKETVVRYIRTQDTHHKKMDYKAELIALLKKHGVPYDPRYVFD